MERYSGTQAMEQVPADPVAEWATPSGETGLEEPMWQLGLGGEPESYPERPDEPDCIYYLRTGFCGYGNRCRFNHPTDRGMAMRAIRAGGGEYPERVGQPICQYYMRTGMCKFGASCKYHHPKQGIGSSAPVALNFYGYPLRPGEKECSYYVKTGQCKFGFTCKFHHPQPEGIQMPVPAPGPGHLTASAAVPAQAAYPTGTAPSVHVQTSQQFGVFQGNWPVARPAMLSGSYVPGSYGPMILPAGVLPVPGWTPYPAPVSPVANPSAQSTVGAAPVYGITQMSPSATAYPGPYLSITSSAGASSGSQKEQLFPERPGLPECQYYLKTGDCKFGATCKYHHPPEWSASKSSYVLSPMGLPLRPGVPLCCHYAQNGVCKFGISCKFDHPMRNLSYTRSTSSLTDMAVAPYPVGSTIATLAPSSSDLRVERRTELMSCMSSNVSASVGSIFSKPESSGDEQGGSSGGSSVSDGGT